MPLVIRLDSELDAGLRALSVEERIPRVEVVRKLIRERFAHPKSRRNAFDIGQEMGVVGMDSDPRRDVAKKHSSYLKKALRAKRTA